MTDSFSQNSALWSFLPLSLCWESSHTSFVKVFHINFFASKIEKCALIYIRRIKIEFCDSPKQRGENSLTPPLLFFSPEDGCDVHLPHVEVPLPPSRVKVGGGPGALERQVAPAQGHSARELHIVGLIRMGYLSMMHLRGGACVSWDLEEF